MSDKTATCSACGKEVDQKDGIKQWDTWFCSFCFIASAQNLHKELTPADIELLKLIGRELAGIMPTELLETILLGYARRITGKIEPPAREETLRVVGEIQRLAFISYARKNLSVLQTLSDSFKEFVESQEREIKDTIKKLTGSE
jgi:hypothetical protein